MTAATPLISIGSSAFTGCTALTDIPALSKVFSLGMSSFEGCINLSATVDLSSLGNISTSAFDKVPVKVSALNTDLASIGSSALSAADMTSVTLPASVKIIGDGAFTSIESGAIKSSAKFNNPVVLPDSLTTLGVNAFGGVKGVSEFQVGPNLETLDRRSFPREVEKITVNNSEDGVVLKNFDTDKDKLIFLVQSITTGDTISDESGAKTLQEAVNEAAAKTDGGTVTLKKDIKLAAP